MIEDGNPRSKSDKPLAEMDLRLALETFREGIYRTFQVCFPACVYSYDKITNKATLMPLIKQGYYNGKWNYKNRPLIKDVTVRHIQCGGITIEIPVHIGDTGWVFSSDRDSLLIKQTGALTNSVLAGDRMKAILEDDYQQPPNQPSLHTFVDGFFLPDNWGTWENWRYKDNREIAIGSALYMGTSIDTNDNREDTTTTETTLNEQGLPNVQTIKKVYQKGDEYEKRASSSLVIEPHGSISMNASAASETNQSSRITAQEGRIKITADNRNSSDSSAIYLDSEHGIVVRKDNDAKKQHFFCNVQGDGLILRMINANQLLSFYFIDGTIHFTTSANINMKIDGKTNIQCGEAVNLRSNGGISVQSEKDVTVLAQGAANVTSKEAHVVAEKEATISSENIAATALRSVNINGADTVNIGSASKTNINAGSRVNLASGGNINVTAASTVNLVSGENTTIMSKRPNAQISITTLSKDSKIDVVTEGKNSQFNLTMNGAKSGVGIVTNEKESSVSVITAGKDSPISIATKGESSKVSIDAYNGDVGVTSGKNIVVTGGKNIAVSGGENVTVEAGKTIDLSGPDVNISGAVEIKGSLKLNGKGFAASIHGKDDKDVKYWKHT